MVRLFNFPNRSTSALKEGRAGSEEKPSCEKVSTSQIKKTYLRRIGVRGARKAASARSIASEVKFLVEGSCFARFDVKLVESEF
jgi:hypothetical protein